MRIYVVCPVRVETEEHTPVLEKYLKDMESQGHEVFFPKRDAPQKSSTGFDIIESELFAIKCADEVHVLWDENSKGSHFDLGMAFALRKKIVFKHFFTPVENKKCYPRALEVYMALYDALELE